MSIENPAVYWHIRCAHPDYLDGRLLEELARDLFDEFILVVENKDHSCKTAHNHLHGRAKDPAMNDQAVRRRIKKRLPLLNGQKHYSLKGGDTVGYVYVSKGTNASWEHGPPSVLATTFAEEHIKTFHGKYWERQAAAHAARDATMVALEFPDQQAEIPKKKKRTKLFVERVRDELVENYPDKTWCIDDDTDLSILTKKLYSKMGETCKNLDNIIWCRMLNGLYSGLPKTYDQVQEEENRLKDAFRRVRDRSS